MANPDPNEDTQWNDVLREKGILPPKKELEMTEEQITKMVDQAVDKHMKHGKAFEDMTLEEIDALEDEEDEKVLREYRNKRIQDMKEKMLRSRFGDVTDITRESYVQQVNNAGKDVWVVLLLYQDQLVSCKLINEYMQRLAAKFPETKFLRSVSTLCIPNYPDHNLPTIFVYHNGDLKQQWIKESSFSITPGTYITVEEFEWMLHQVGAVQSTMKEDPRLKRSKAKATILLQQKGIGKGNNSSDSDSD